MKRVIIANANKPSDNIRTYQNNRNPNKYIEVKKGNDGHSYMRQYMKWDTDNGEVKNYTASRTNRGRYQRARQSTIDQALEDYTEVNAAADLSAVGEIGKYYECISDSRYEELTGADPSVSVAEELDGYDATHLCWLEAKPGYFDALARDNYEIMELVMEGDDGTPFIGYTIGDRLYSLDIREVKALTEGVKGCDSKITASEELHHSQCSFDFTWTGDNYDYKTLAEAVTRAFDSIGLSVDGVDFYSVDYSQYPEYADYNVSQCSADFSWVDGYDSNEIFNALQSEMESEGCSVIGIDFNSL